MHSFSLFMRAHFLIPASSALRCIRHAAVFMLFVTAMLPAVAQTDSTPPRNILLFIGDGMGPAHVSALQLTRTRTHIARMPVAGFSVTCSASHLVTESAAGATALATGRRTKNERVAVDSAGAPLRSLLDAAHACGKSTGVVVTCALTHATPAAFLSHATSRKLQHDIAVQIAEGTADVLIGGGTEWFLPREDGGTRSDGRDLRAVLEARGLTCIDTLPAHAASPSRLCMLLAPDALPPAGKRPYTLADLVRTAIAASERAEHGFVLMVEGSQIDWAAHDNALPQLLAELRDFDDAIGAALDFAQRDARTLVVVTADHETGGLTLTGTRPDGTDLVAHWSSDNHTASMVPVFAFGPCARQFGGIHANQDIGRMLLDLLPATCADR